MNPVNRAPKFGVLATLHAWACTLPRIIVFCIVLVILGILFGAQLLQVSESFNSQQQSITVMSVNTSNESVNTANSAGLRHSESIDVILESVRNIVESPIDDMNKIKLLAFALGTSDSESDFDSQPNGQWNASRRVILEPSGEKQGRATGIQVAPKEHLSQHRQTGTKFQFGAPAIRQKHAPQQKSLTWCSATEMLSPLVPLNSSTQHLIQLRRYTGVSCKFISSNYKCKPTPYLADFIANISLQQIPSAAAEQKCALFVNKGQYPYPAGSRLLYWGNSHIREVITAIGCQYPHATYSILGSDQRHGCGVQDYRLTPTQREILFRQEYDNNSTVFGVTNCALMYDKAAGIEAVGQLLRIDFSQLTHVIANPGNVARWAVDWEFKDRCSNHTWYQRLASKSGRDKFNWAPFREPEHLGAVLQSLGFTGKLIWTLPFWCSSNKNMNR